MNYSETLMWKEISQIPSVFSDILLYNKDVMNELVSAIKNGSATNFVAAARGASDHAMVFFKYVLEINSDYTVSLSAPSVITLYKGRVNYSNSVVIGCSESGRAEDVLEVLKKANEQGAITIGITNDLESPIAKEAKFHLYCNAGKENSVVATKSFHAQMFLLLWLAAEVASKRSILRRLNVLGKEFATVFKQIDLLTSVYAERFKKTTGGFVLSRGLTYAVALETALILQETCYMQMKGYAGSDFYHGPMALVSENTPVIIFCAKHFGDEEMQAILRADQIKCIEKMLLLRAPVLLVTNDCLLVGKFSKCNDALINFSESEEIAIFAFALFGQMLACKMSCFNGNNPDSPRSIEQVTITK